MHLAIDASNIRQGGGLTHLSQLLSVATPCNVGISQITVWASRATLAELPSKPWLKKVAPAWAEAGLFKRILGQQILLRREMSSSGCNALFSPGGTLPFSLKIPAVTMSQNMLPFEPLEAIRFGSWSWMRLKMWLLRRAQVRSFRSASGIIFLTNYARKVISNWVSGLEEKSVIVPHGIEPRFSMEPRQQKPASELSLHEPLTVLYVSILMPYKHQIEVARAISELRQLGYPIQAKFLGSNWGEYGKEFKKILRILDPSSEYLVWRGGVPYADLHHKYAAADMFVFASSCENLPNILIEAMAAGLPIACSDRGPMQEVLGNSGIYFDPENPDSIAEALIALIENVALREQLAKSAWMESQKYSWERCAHETLAFISAIAKNDSRVKYRMNN